MAEAEPEPELASEGAVILFDGVCNLCEGIVRFIIPRDPTGHFRFAPLQSATAAGLLGRYGLPTGDLDTFVLIEDGRSFTRSDAALRLFGHLSGPWPLLRVLTLVPRPLRDWAYGVVVRNRYRWFGRKEVCGILAPGFQDRFLDGNHEGLT